MIWNYFGDKKYVEYKHEHINIETYKNKAYGYVDLNKFLCLYKSNMSICWWNGIYGRGYELHNIFFISWEY